LLWDSRGCRTLYPPARVPAPRCNSGARRWPADAAQQQNIARELALCRVPAAACPCRVRPYRPRARWHRQRARGGSRATEGRARGMLQCACMQGARPRVRCLLTASWSLLPRAAPPRPCASTTRTEQVIRRMEVERPGPKGVHLTDTPAMSLVVSLVPSAAPARAGLLRSANRAKFCRRARAVNTRPVRPARARRLLSACTMVAGWQVGQVWGLSVATSFAAPGD
jgi:hypothetical protein